MGYIWGTWGAADVGELDDRNLKMDKSTKKNEASKNLILNFLYHSNQLYYHVTQIKH